MCPAEIWYVIFLTFGSDHIELPGMRNKNMSNVASLRCGKCKTRSILRIWGDSFFIRLFMPEFSVMFHYELNYSKC